MHTIYYPVLPPFRLWCQDSRKRQQGVAEVTTKVPSPEEEEALEEELPPEDTPEEQLEEEKSPEVAEKEEKEEEEAEKEEEEAEKEEEEAEKEDEEAEKEEEEAEKEEEEAEKEEEEAEKEEEEKDEEGVEKEEVEKEEDEEAEKEEEEAEKEEDKAAEAGRNQYFPFFFFFHLFAWILAGEPTYIQLLNPINGGKSATTRNWAQDKNGDVDSEASGGIGRYHVANYG